MIVENKIKRKSDIYCLISTLSNTFVVLTLYFQMNLSLPSLY